MSHDLKTPLAGFMNGLEVINGAYQELADCLLLSSPHTPLTAHTTGAQTVGAQGTVGAHTVGAHIVGTDVVDTRVQTQGPLMTIRSNIVDLKSISSFMLMTVNRYDECTLYAVLCYKYIRCSMFYDFAHAHNYDPSHPLYPIYTIIFLRFHPPS